MNFDIFIISIRFSMVELVGIESNIVKIARLIFRTWGHPNPPKASFYRKMSHWNLVWDYLSYRLVSFSAMGIVVGNVNIMGSGYPFLMRCFGPLIYWPYFNSIDDDVIKIMKSCRWSKVKTKKMCAQRGARTHDPEIKSLMLYRLS